MTRDDHPGSQAIAGRAPLMVRFPAAVATTVIAVLVLVASCSSPAAAPSTTTGSPAPGIPVGSSSHTITVAGTARTFLVYRPGSLSPTRPVPLVVMIHGGGGSAAGAERSYGWDAEADRGQFIVAYPDGIHHGWSVGGGCCQFTGSTTVTDDVAFISQLVTTVGREAPIDPTRVYATGISEGGMMSYRLACDITIFAAIGPDSATLLGACPSPAPLSVIHIHGTADTRIPYDGSAGSGVHHIQGAAVPALNATWRATDQCAAPAITRSGMVSTSVADCMHNRDVELITIAGAGHQWPGAACNTASTPAAPGPSTTRWRVQVGGRRCRP